jgi:hypothetical protein
VEIIAAGHGDWIGWVQLATEAVNEIVTRITARVIWEIDADISADIEVDPFQRRRGRRRRDHLQP